MRLAHPQGQVRSEPAQLDRGDAATTRPVRLVIASGHPITRSGLRWLLESRAELSVAGKAASVGEAVALAAQRQADLILLDTALLATASPNKMTDGGGVRFILVADSAADRCLHAALQLDVRGVVFKDSTADALFNCIESVMRGRYWMDGTEVPDIAAGLRSVEAAARARQAAFGLTRREVEIIRSVVAGYSNKEIARLASISENTVKCHLSRIFDKLGASNRVELALFAAHHRLLDAA